MEKAVVPPEKKQYQEIGEDLRAQIIQGHYPVGSRLPPERNIAEKYGVSRTIVREALLMLELQGTVDIRQGSGVYVMRIPAEHEAEEERFFSSDIGPFEMLQARQLLESNIAAFAAKMATKADIDNLRRILEQEQRAIAMNDTTQDNNKLFHLVLADGSVEDVPMGVFEVSEANRLAKCLELKAYDFMLRFDKSFNGFETVGTAYDFIALCCKMCRVELAHKRAEIDAMPNGGVTLSVYTENDIETCRDVLFYVAQVLGGFFIINREGKLELRKYGKDPVMKVEQRHRFSSSFSDFITRYTAVSSTNKQTQIAEYYALDPDNGLTMNLGVNPFLQFGLKETREMLCRNILADLSVIRYVPFDSDTIGNPALDPGDVLTFAGGQADEGQITCITSIRQKIGGKQSLKCVGKNPRLAQAKSRNDKNISGLLNQIEDNAKTGKIGIHTFTNASAHEIGQTKVKLISIQFASSEENHMQFFAQAVVDVAADPVERSAEVAGTVVIPFPGGSGGTGSGTGGSDGTGETLDEGNSENDVAGNEVGNTSGNENTGSTDDVSGGSDSGSGSGTEVSVDVCLPVKWQEDGQAVCPVVFEFNNEEIVEHCPVETWHSGKHILSLYYPIEKIVANYTNTFNVYLWMENGSGTVDVGDCIASVSGQAMAAGEAWDGKLEVEDYTTRFAIGGGLNVNGFRDSLSMQMKETVNRGFEVYFAERAGISGFSRPVEMEGV